MKILLADDNANYLNLVGNLLRERGHEVFLCEEGKQARELLQEQAVDLVISDVYMPILDGYRFHSYVRDFMGNGNIPFIFVSGFEPETLRGVVLESERDFFVSKMSPVQDMLDLIERMNDGPKSCVAPGLS